MSRGLEEGVPRYIAHPIELPLTFRKANSEFVIKADSEEDALKECLEKVKGTPIDEIFPDEEDQNNA